VHIFMSYARADQQKADGISTWLSQLGHTVWLDQRLSGGQQWWDQILTQIRAADAVVALLSPTCLRSQACSGERRYARSLGKPLLPVLIEHVSRESLPEDLSLVQFVDYTSPGEAAAFSFAAAVASLPPAPPLPDPMPPPPVVPLSYLSHLGQRLAATTLSYDDQVDISSRLDAALRAQDPEERAAARGLLGSLRDRPDIYAFVAEKVDLAVGSAASSSPSSGPEERQARPPQPSGPGHRRPEPPPQQPAASSFYPSDRQDGRPQPTSPSFAGGPYRALLPPSAQAVTKPDNYLVWAILSTVLCCLPTGVVSIVLAMQVDKKYQAGDYRGAVDASRNARTWAVISAVLGVVVVFVYALGSAGGY